MPTRFLHLLILLLLLAAFALRLGHLLGGIFHIDEYISMLAAQMTAQKGAPILPSGLLYHQGLLLSYLAAPFIALLGFREEIARWPSLLAGMLAVAAFYRVARQIFQSPLAGLLALTLATLDVSMILWSARMRMYALAGLFMLLALYFLLQGTLLQPSRRARLAAIICLVGAMLTHSVAVVALPVWALALGICLAVGQRKFNLAWYRQKSFVPELALTLLLIMIGVAFSVGGQIPFLSPGVAEASDGGADGGGGLWGVFNKFLEPGVSWERVDDFIYTYTSAEYGPLLLLAGVSFGLALLAALRGRLTRRDMAVLLLGLIFLLTIAELGLALSSTWRKTRYLFILCHAPFLLLAADGLARIFEALARFLPSRPPTATQRPATTNHLLSTIHHPLSTSFPLLPTTYYPSSPSSFSGPAPRLTWRQGKVRAAMIPPSNGSKCSGRRGIG
ncbi:MAG TPA: glycosyltransferase family 39 protein [Anaerolineae bacterium]|nr:glycosyltransferase family 39 protein [Anaerolineae bacterium]